VWSLDLAKLQSWKLVKEVSVPEQEFGEPIHSSEDEEGGDDGGEEAD
jgi:hypothetical protein